MAGSCRTYGSGLGALGNQLPYRDQRVPNDVKFRRGHQDPLFLQFQLLPQILFESFYGSRVIDGSVDRLAPELIFLVLHGGIDAHGGLVTPLSGGAGGIAVPPRSSGIDGHIAVQRT